MHPGTAHTLAPFAPDCTVPKSVEQEVWRADGKHGASGGRSGEAQEHVCPGHYCLMMCVHMVCVYVWCVHMCVHVQCVLVCVHVCVHACVCACVVCV